jgi:hypothetical protein
MIVGMPAKWSIASVPAGPQGPAEGAKWSRGMAMSMNEKLRFLLLLVVVVFGFVFHHFCASAIEALGKIIATNIISLPALAKFTAGIFGMFFLH